MGTRFRTVPFCPVSRDHPHAYGDKYTRFAIITIIIGSSPRVWGQAKILPLHTVDDRIIPTRMGTSFRYILRIIALQDHPHAYGDKSYTAFKTTADLGSSPRVWGQESTFFDLATFCGIIPTRMGTRYNFNPIPIDAEDHPHAYGDKKYVWRASFASLGSSPRVWGQAELVTIYGIRIGIIPTRMGTSAILFCRCARS